MPVIGSKPASGSSSNASCCKSRARQGSPPQVQGSSLLGAGRCCCCCRRTTVTDPRAPCAAAVAQSRPICSALRPAPLLLLLCWASEAVLLQPRLGRLRTRLGCCCCSRQPHCCICLGCHGHLWGCKALLHLLLLLLALLLLGLPTGLSHCC
jgi:hypothetical protein